MREKEIISILQENFPQSGGNFEGIGRDCARLENFYITTDTFVEGVHFNCEWFGPQELAYKFLQAQLSDLSTRGCSPRFALFNCSIPQNFCEKYWSSFLLEMIRLLKHYGLTLLGGDTTSSRDSLVMSMTVWGEKNPKECLDPNRIESGDKIFVYGKLGGAAYALEKLYQGKDLSTEELRPLLHPPVLLEVGETWIQSPGVKEMTDLSDGLFHDLKKLILKKGLSFALEEKNIPLTHSKVSLEQALFCGEDYTLAGVGDPEGLSGVTVVGEIITADSPQGLTQKISRPYSHFKD